MPERKSKRRGATDKCSVKDCDGEAYRSLSTRKVIDALPDYEYDSEDHKRTHLCKKHYREFKRATKDDRKLEHMGWD